VHPTIPHGTLPKLQAQRKREYPEAKEDSKPENGGDGSPQWIVNMWAMMWESTRPTPGKLCKGNDDGCLGVGCVSHLAAGLCVTLYNSIKKSVIEYIIRRN